MLIATGILYCTAMQRQNTEISKQIFPEKEYRGLSPNFHIHAFVTDLYIATIGLPILLEEILYEDRSWDNSGRGKFMPLPLKSKILVKPLDL